MRMQEVGLRTKETRLLEMQRGRMHGMQAGEFMLLFIFFFYMSVAYALYLNKLLTRWNHRNESRDDH